MEGEVSWPGESILSSIFFMNLDYQMDRWVNGEEMEPGCIIERTLGTSIYEDVTEMCTTYINAVAE